MRRNCNLELRLSPSSSSGPSISQRYNGGVEELPKYDDSPPSSSSLLTNASIANESRQLRQQQQQLTIFYDGKVVSCDVTELQARAIILLAGQERTNTSKITGTGYSGREFFSSPKKERLVSEPSSPLLKKQLYSPNDLSMKRSLQRFLQKRKNRVQATSPYHHY